MRKFVLALILIFSPSFVWADMGGWSGQSLGQHNNVDQSTTPSDGQILKWNDTLKKWEYQADGGGSVSDTVYGAGWNGDTTVAPSKNAVYDKIETLFSSASIDTSAELAAILTDEIGTAGALVFSTNPVFSGIVDNQTNDSATATVTELYRLTHTSTGTVAANFGAGIDAYLEDASGNAAQQAGRIAIIWTDATEASEDSAIVFSGVSAGGALTELVRITGSGNFGIGTTGPSVPFQAEGESGIYRTGLKVDTNDNSYGPTLVGYTDRDANERIFFRGSFTAADNQSIYWGSSSVSRLTFSTTGNDNLQLGLFTGSGTGSGYVSIIESADTNNANRSPLATTTNPTLRIYSSDATSATDYGEFYQDGTNFNIGVGEGVVTITGGGLTSTAGTTTLGTVAGAVDAGGATSFEVPNGANPTTDAAGEIAVDTSAAPGSGIRFYGDAAYTIAGTYSKSFVITSPTASADAAIWRVPYNITIKAIHGVQVGGTNVVGMLTENDSNGLNPVVVDSADMTITTSNVNDDGSLSNPTLDAGDYLGWATTSVSGTITRVTITYEYVID